MTPRDEKGRFVRADKRPVLHRQVAERPSWYGDTGTHSVEVLPGWRAKWQYERKSFEVSNHGETPLYVPLPVHITPDLEPLPDPHDPRLDMRLVVLTAVALALMVAHMLDVGL